jgi:hypothetical protein
MNLHNALRRLVPEEVKALLEKIDSLDDSGDSGDSSSYAIRNLLNNGSFTWLEHKLLREAWNRKSRRYTLRNAMHIVIYGDVEKPSNQFYVGQNVRTGAISGTGSITSVEQTFAERLGGVATQKKVRKVAPYGHP